MQGSNERDAVKLWTVYSIVAETHPTHIRYIGITSKSLATRLHGHMRAKSRIGLWLRQSNVTPLIKELEQMYGTRAMAESREDAYIQEYLRLGHDLLNVAHVPLFREEYVEYLRRKQAN